MPSVIGIWTVYGMRDRKKENGIRELKPEEAALIKIGKNGYITSILKKKFGKPKEDSFLYRETDTPGVYEAYTYAAGTRVISLYKFRAIDDDKLVLVYPPDNKVLANAIFYYQRAKK